MTLRGSITAGLQAFSSWFMSVLSLLAILVSVIVCICPVEFIIGRSAVAQAYTVKTNSAETGAPLHRWRKHRVGATPAIGFLLKLQIRP
jgi:hypothetical protein